MESWKQDLADSVSSVEELATRFPADTDRLQQVAARYPMRITRHYFELIREPGDPIWRQAVPDPAELGEDNLLVADPLHEDRLSPVPGLIHRYPDRVVLLVSSTCSMYCRFCLRKRQVGCSAPHLSSQQFDEAVSYIAATPTVRDVVLSGGEPLLLDDGAVAHILSSLRNIPHLEIIRIGTRTPVTLPSRITPGLCTLLKRFHPIYINTHFNHPLEITAESAAACAMLADAGIPLGNQTVLLKGVNDDPETMKVLMQKLLAIRVRPYYIHQMDLVKGTGHFRTRIETGIGILRGLRGHISGLAIPHFVVDAPGGKGKVPLLPEYGERRGAVWLLRNYLGEEIEYREDGLD